MKVIEVLQKLSSFCLKISEKNREKENNKPLLKQCESHSQGKDLHTISISYGDGKNSCSFAY